MKKLLSLLCGLVLLFSMGIVCSADTIETGTIDMQVTPAMLAYEQELLDKIENDLDAIHQEINDYQAGLASPLGVTYGGFQYLDGDILVTKSTSSAGLTGHVGILVGSKVLEITPKYNNGLPAAISLATWYSRYPTTMVMRYTATRDIPVDAAWYGQTFYIDGAGADNTYSLTGSMTDLTTDYCSSLVWKAYHYGADLDFETYHDSVSFTGYRVPSFIYPYDYINDRSHNGFSAVHSVNW